MSNSEQARQEDPEEHDLDIEIVNLKPSTPTDTIDKIKHGLSARTVEKLPLRPFLLRRGNSQLAATATVVLIGLLLLLSASGVLSSLIARITHPSAVVSRVSPAHSTSSLLQQGNLGCLIDTAWSPDNQHIAVLGYSGDCPQGTNQYQPGLVDVYDARAARLVIHIHPDPAILFALKKQFKQFASKRAQPVILFWTILWSHDGHSLVLLFSAGTSLNSSNPSGTGVDGLLLLRNDGRQQVFLRQEKPGEFQIASYLQWNVQQGVAKVVPFHAAIANSYQFIPTHAALSFHWGVDDLLVLGTQTASSASALNPIGNPVGDSSFSIWQPGFIFLVTQNQNGLVHLPGVYVWQAFFPAWSPDGRTLIDEVLAGVVLEVPGQKLLSRQALKDLGVDQLPILHVQDQALVHMLHSPTPMNGNQLIRVSWRPDGRILAAYGAGSGAGSVDIYDCATGRKLTSLVLATPASGLKFVSGSRTGLRWSPDGKRLFFFGSVWGPQLWGPGQLPK